MDLLHAQNLAACVRNFDLSAPGEPSQAHLGPASALRDAVYDLLVSEAATNTQIAVFVSDIDEASKPNPSRKAPASVPGRKGPHRVKPITPATAGLLVESTETACREKEPTV